MADASDSLQVFISVYAKKKRREPGLSPLKNQVAQTRPAVRRSARDEWTLYVCRMDVPQTVTFAPGTSHVRVRKLAMLSPPHKYRERGAKIQNLTDMTVCMHRHTSLRETLSPKIPLACVVARGRVVPQAERFGPTSPTARARPL
jgi:hypothetical protein